MQNFDLFISYNASTAPFARACVEDFIAAGWRVWFGEYAILSEDYLADEEIIMRRCLNAIADSRPVLVIVGEGWVKSIYCLHELLGLPGKDVAQGGVGEMP